MVKHMLCAENLLVKATTGAIGLNLNRIQALRSAADVKHRRHLFNYDETNNGQQASRKSSVRSHLKV
jgi:hypothetical protein